MNRNIFVGLSLLAALAVGIAAGRWWIPDDGGVEAGPAEGKREVLYWKAPMDPNYRRDEPGKSPMGMDLVPVYADEAAADQPGVVRIDPMIVNNLGVRTALVEEGALSRRIETVGYVDYDEDTMHQINTRVDGWIEKLTIKATGDPVKRGQVLFELYSPTLVNAQEEYLMALKSRNTGLQQASRDRLGALGITDAEIKRLGAERKVRQRVKIYAETDGVVSHLAVREGTYITPATMVVSIADLAKVWILAEVFERQAAWVEPGQKAEVELDYLPGERWSGVVDYVYPELDPRTRTLKVRLRFDNSAGALRPNMFTRVTIYGRESASMVHIPQEALIRGGSVDRVVLALGDGMFRAQPVEIGIVAGNRIGILRGLAEGDRIVTSGQFLIDSESNIDTALARMDGADSEPDAQPAPGEVHVNATVVGSNQAQRRITLDHEAIPSWSWPSMTMSFDVADEKLLTGLDDGQAVEVTIKKHADDHYVITELMPVSPPGHDHAPSAAAGEMDHSTHSMSSPVAETKQETADPGRKP